MIKNMLNFPIFRNKESAILCLIYTNIVEYRPDTYHHK